MTRPILYYLNAKEVNADRSDSIVGHENLSDQDPPSTMLRLMIRMLDSDLNMKLSFHNDQGFLNQSLADTIRRNVRSQNRTRAVKTSINQSSSERVIFVVETVIRNTDFIGTEYPTFKIRELMKYRRGTCVEFLVQLEYNVKKRVYNHVDAKYVEVARFDHNRGHDITEEGVKLDLYRLKDNLKESKKEEEFFPEEKDGIPELGSASDQKSLDVLPFSCILYLKEDFEWILGRFLNNGS